MRLKSIMILVFLTVPGVANAQGTSDSTLPKSPPSLDELRQAVAACAPFLLTDNTKGPHTYQKGKEYCDLLYSTWMDAQNAATAADETKNPGLKAAHDLATSLGYVPNQ